MDHRLMPTKSHILLLLFPSFLPLPLSLALCIFLFHSLCFAPLFVIWKSRFVCFKYTQNFVVCMQFKNKGHAEMVTRRIGRFGLINRQTKWGFRYEDYCMQHATWFALGFCHIWRQARAHRFASFIAYIGQLCATVWLWLFNLDQFPGNL